MSLSLSAGGREFRSCSETRIYQLICIHSVWLDFERVQFQVSTFPIFLSYSLISLAFFCSIFIFCSSSTKANVAFKSASSFWSRNVSPVTQLMELAFDPILSVLLFLEAWVDLLEAWETVLILCCSMTSRYFFSDLMSVTKFNNSRSTCSTILSMSRRYSSGFANDLMSSTMPWNSE